MMQTLAWQVILLAMFDCCTCCWIDVGPAAALVVPADCLLVHLLLLVVGVAAAAAAGLAQI